MRPLHQMNPARVGWVMERIAEAFPGRTGLRVLDVGCGAGLAAEAFARHGLSVVGIDAAADAIAAAAAHAAAQGEAGQRLDLAYRVAAPEDLVAEGARFPVITALEVVEHVTEPAAFLRTLAELLEPGGLLVLSTLNRTRASFIAAKLGAEYVLRWLPVGTHDWRRFLPPAELARALRFAGLRPRKVKGLSYDPVRGGWRISADLSVNYVVAARA
jgi:2-polyprenyl-6-hydroxyphenyl methylase/3-demethylubiquinone-9 3-methyltransferase